MKQTLLSIGYALACAALLTISVRRAQAQIPVEESPEYRALIGEALAEFDRSHFVEARALFLKAHGVKPSARTLRGLGLVSFELREYAATLAYLEQALASRENPLEGELRTGTEQLLQRTGTFVGRFRPSVEPVHARMRIDGTLVSTVAPVVLDIGAHVVVVDASNYLSETRHLRVLGGEDQPLPFVLAPQLLPSTAPTPAPALPAVSLPPPEPAHEVARTPALTPVSAPTPRVDEAADGGRKRRIWLWTAAAVAVIGSAGIVTGVLLARRKDDDALSPPVSTPNTVAVLAPLWRGVRTP